ncbi:MAG: Rne/Rng family ribonuclease [Acidobacteriota bacterium]|nr:Rne/Rng family ribonuclease [Acidobacteriota bacterium]
MASELFVSRVGFQTWAAVTEQGRLAEIRIEHRDHRSRVGDVVTARVKKVATNIDAVFVDIGDERDAFLAASELVLPAELERGGASADRPVFERVAPGHEIIVQIEREPTGAKGARVTGYLDLPGRHLVYHPFSEERTVASRIVDVSERERLLTVVRGLPQPGGFVVRTVGEGAPEKVFRAEAAALAETWSEILNGAARATAPALLHRDLDLPRRTLRDLDWADLDRVRVDDAEIREALVAYTRLLDPATRLRIDHHEGPAPLFRAVGVDRDLRRALRPQVWLRSGAHLVIEQTEALVSIDVNTGRSGGRRPANETAVRINLEAAEEIARQIRLRDLGGTIVIDFIDMHGPGECEKVRELLARAMRRDRARTRIVGMSDEGVVQIARRRSRAGLDGALTRACPTCSGHGRVRSPATVAGSAIVELRRLLAVPAGARITVRAHPDVADELRRVLAAGVEPGIESGRVDVVSDESLHPERFRLIPGS